ncbi:methyl-accepting chemotaxis protein (MCP) signaling protein [Mobilisporobacter senegalensis]|uniref:Methyl-accepting chemotaxis protein (MCP) signaling protein n=1 Tax=Mobilisporobacter senegalensis TaxID=1329262 RepID=A0A3N1XMY9_9FIRM|nr:methyl-accepting chemotaxis protein [Mobilisporobacter senegalensis]ROR26442.1 methyl-accepting chemotaxis protein (MCP) signaling protein [Mobilisporobacter senegalensis]
MDEYVVDHDDEREKIQTEDNLIKISREMIAVAKEQGEFARNAKGVIEQLDESQLKVEKNAFDAINSSDTALNLVKEGKKNIEILTAKIEILNKVASSVTDNIRQMEQLTAMISGFANIIAGISNKTNMLSLNASIEAARAGEQGKGFAVVAGEVRNLAEQSAKSSKEIAETVASVHAFSTNMGKDIEQLFNIMKEQDSVTKEMEDVFNQILEASLKSNDVSRNMEHEIAFQRDVTDNVKNAVISIAEIAAKAEGYSGKLV